MPFNQAKRSNISHGRRPTFLLPLLLLFTCVASTSSVTSAADNDRPNVVVVMADDLGYGDIGCYGAKGLETPNIDRIASEGCRFTSGYCSASTCTPTRYSFLTGTYAFRFPNTGIAPPNSPALIPAGLCQRSQRRKLGPDGSTLGRQQKAIRRSSHRDHPPRHVEDGLVTRSQLHHSQRHQPHWVLHRWPRGSVPR